MNREQHRRLLSCCARGDAPGALRALGAAGHCFTHAQDNEDTAEEATLLMAACSEDGTTALHALCTGEALGPLGGCLVWALQAPAGGVWPARHQTARQHLLSQLAQRHPRLALHAGTRNAAGVTPLHCAVLSQSLGVLAHLLATLQQLLFGPAAAGACPSSSSSAAASGRSDRGSVGSTSGAATLQLLLSVPDATGLTPLELAVQRQQWAAARLLAAAARGGLPLSQAQMEACDLVKRSLGSAAGRQRDGKRGGGGGAGPAGAAGGVHISSSGPTIAEALGGVLSKLWDAFGASAAEAERGKQEQHDELAPGQALQGGDSGTGAGTSGGGSGNKPSSAPLQHQVLLPEALGQAAVLALASRADAELAGAAGTAAGGAAAEPAPATTTAEVAAPELAPVQGEASGVLDSRGQMEGAPTAGASCQAGGADAAVEAAAGTASATAAAAGVVSSSGPAAQTCLVCYDELPPGCLRVQLRCGHTTCNECWRGILLASIDEGDPRRARCPHPGCSVPLPSSAAPRLLPARSLSRFQQLVAQRYVATHPAGMRCCPRPGCGATLHLPDALAAALAAPRPAGGEATRASGSAAASGKAGAAGSAGGSAAAPVQVGQEEEAGLDTECATCMHRFCWRCGEDAHEPATCAQIHRWGEQLAALRQAAPDADRQWLHRNSKRCPQCKTHIQKLGGCNHMRCSGCGHHFCWVCGRSWSEHSVETGGYYYCNLEERDDLPEYGAGGGGGGGGLLGGPLAWMAGVWSSIKAAAQQQQLQGHLRQYLRHSGGTAQLWAAAAHMQLLLEASGVAGARGSGGGNSGSGSSRHGMAATAAADGSFSEPDVLGVRPAEARRMGRAEWSDLVAAAAASAALSADVPASLTGPAARAAAEAALDAALGANRPGNTGSSSGGGGGSSKFQATQYLLHLATSLSDAHSVLQHTAAALFCMPSGPARRQLQALQGAIQQRVERLEPLLLALPEREGLPTPPPSARQQQQAQQGVDGGTQAQDEKRARTGSGGFAGWLLRRLYGIEAPPAAAAGSLTPDQRARLAALSPDVLLQQHTFAAAVHQQRDTVHAVLGVLNADMQELRAAARAGAYAG